MSNRIYNDEMVLKAKEYAYNLHKNDKCIVTNENKILHLEAVVKKIKNLNLKNNILVILAYLHDSLDYANKNKKSKILTDIQKIFGNYIAQLVLEVSDNFKIEDISTEKGMANFEARRIQIESPSGISDYAAKIVLAEKVCNLSGMLDAIKKSGKTYWENFSSSHHLKEEDVKEYYDLIYDVLSDRCYGDIRLRSMLDEYDDLSYQIFG